MKKELNENSVRVIKISKEALFEFIYEKFIDDEELFFDIDLLDVTSTFDINFERGEFICCVSKAEDADGKILKLPEEIDLQQLMVNIPDTTSTMFADSRYKEFTKEELIEISKKAKNS
ncbi:MAG: hypothetical protein E7444_00725 [Ruminococcaceae bacterium]|nr:hypothetical protein [Oscillospiraceae bacterium]